MIYIELFLLSLALTADAVTVSSVVGCRYNYPRAIFRISFHFGLFQALFPLIGALAGITILHLITPWDKVLVFVVLFYIGFKMITGAFKNDDDEVQNKDLSRGWTMIGLSVAVSIDALGAGLLLPSLEIPLHFSVTLIGLTTLILSVVSMIFARRLRFRFGKKVEIIGGSILILLALKTLLSDLI